MLNIPSRFIAALITISALLTILMAIPGRSDAQTRDAFIRDEVAFVNDDVLMEDELLFTLIRMFGDEMVISLLEDEIIISQADLIGVSLDPNDVEEYLATAYSPEKLTALEAAFGGDLLRHTVGNQILALNVVTAKIDQVVTEHDIEITEDQIRDYYLANLLLWTTPALVRFSLIETDTMGESQAAKQRIHDGEDFADVCGDVSTHPVTRAYGGDIGGLVPQGSYTGERAILEDSAFDLGIGEVSSPLEVEEKWYLVMPTEKTDYYEPTLEELHDRIHVILLDNLVQPYLDEWMSVLFDDAEIEITYPILIGTSPTPGVEGSFIAPTIGVVNGRSIPEGAMLFHLLREYGSEAIQSMIEEILFVQVKDELGVSITEQDVRDGLAQGYDAEVLEILETAFGADVIYRTFVRFLAANNVVGAKWQKIVDDHDINVTDDEILDYYLENLKYWTKPEMVRISMILLATEADANEARERIVMNDESFEDVCREVSIDDGTRMYGGDIGSHIFRGLFTGESAAIEDNAFSLAVDDISQPFQVGVNWFIIKVTEKLDAEEPTLGEKREEIYAILLENRISPFLSGWRSSLWDASDINVVYPIYTEPMD